MLRTVPLDPSASSPHAAALAEQAASALNHAYLAYLETEASFSPVELGAICTGARYRTDLAVVVDAADQVLTVALLRDERRDQPGRGLAQIFPAPGGQRRGATRAALDWAESRARELGIVHLLATALSAGGPEGADDVTRQDRIAAARGFTLGQVMAGSVLDVPFSRRVDTAEESVAGTLAGQGRYRVEVAVDRPPESWICELATMYRRFSTDAPAGDVPTAEEDQSPDDVREQLDRAEQLHARYLRAAAFDQATGEMVAFTDISCDEASPTLANQGMTLVIREHRGHRLGMAVKVANLRAVEREWPLVKRIVTGNADDNAWMLAINRELGFRPGPVMRTFVTSLGEDAAPLVD